MRLFVPLMRQSSQRWLSVGIRYYNKARLALNASTFGVSTAHVGHPAQWDDT
ncbi:hypothetical protein Q1J68_19970 [Pseudomonas pergaminensis]|uniref:hypothetical protein n=1 Tax=Pseudomonas pergaminensis TaxID=2853159 RepID=UPI0034D7698B